MSRLELSRAVRFVAYNLIGMALDVTLVYVLHHLLDAPWIVAVSCGWVVASVVAYFLNRRFVFQDGTATVRDSSLRFFLLGAFNLGVGVGLVTLAVEHGSPYIVTRLASSGFLVLLNFAINRGWVFAVPALTDSAP
jgi:putative flippase GtrA